MMIIHLIVFATDKIGELVVVVEAFAIDTMCLG